MSITIKEGTPGDIVIPSFAVQMNDEEFFRFATQFSNIQIERDKDGNIFIMPPTGFESGSFESDAITELNIWNRKHKAGKTFSSQTGFVLPNSAMRAPDASWISDERIASIPIEEHSRFAHICPDFVLEIRSASDSLPGLKAKMEEYIENGARLGFLIDPMGGQAFVYRADGSVEQVAGLDEVLNGGDVLAGFELPLALFKTA